MSKLLFNKIYCSEELYDVERDVSEAFDENFNVLMKDIPTDEHGFHDGTFTINITYDKGEE